MKKRIVAMAMAVMMAATAMGCGKSNGKLSVSTGTSGEHVTSDDHKVTTEIETKTLSQVLSENEYTIWFDINSVDKSTGGMDVVIFYNDGTYISTVMLGKKLGECSQMSDEEIKSYVEENSQSAVSYDKGKYYLSVWTDATGNNVQKELICFVDSDGKQGKYYTLTGAVADQPLYDSYYGGYYKTGIGYDMLVMRADFNTRFELDAVGTDGIAIDSFPDAYSNADHESETTASTEAAATAD